MNQINPLPISQNPLPVQNPVLIPPEIQPQIPNQVINPPQEEIRKNKSQK